MRKLFLFLVVLFLSFQQVTLAAIKEMTSTPDSVYLFSFATSGDDGRSGLRFAWSMDKENWTAVDSFRWERNGDMKVFTFKDQPKARYIKLHITEGVGNYASGRELYVFKVPGTESYLPGDINNDKKIDTNDLTSYMNYTGCAVVTAISIMSAQVILTGTV